MADAVTAARKGVQAYRRLAERERRQQAGKLLHQRQGRILEFARMRQLAGHRAELERQGRERIELARGAAEERTRQQNFDEMMSQIKLLPDEHDRLAASVQLNVKAGRQTEKWGEEAMELIEKDRKFVRKEKETKARTGLLAKFNAADPEEKRTVIEEGIVSGLLDPKMAQQWRATAVLQSQVATKPTVAQVRTKRMDELKRTGDALKVFFRRTITTASPKKTRGAGLTTGLLNDLAGGAMAAAQQQYGDRVTPAQIMKTAQDFLRQNWDWIYVQANTTKRPYGGVDVPRGAVPVLAPFEERRPPGPGREQEVLVDATTGPTPPPGADPSDPLGWR